MLVLSHTKNHLKPRIILLEYPRKAVCYTMRLKTFRVSIIQRSLMSVRLSLKISVINESIEFYTSENIPAGPMVVLGYFLKGGGHKKKLI